MASKKSDLFVIEVLRPNDYACFCADGQQLVAQMQALGFDTRYVRAYDKKSFKDAVSQFGDSKFKWLHISCHGADNGIELYDEKWESKASWSPEIVCFSEFAKLFETTLATCRMTISGCRTGNEDLARNMFMHNTGLQSVVAPAGDLPIDIAAPLWVSFYTLLIRQSRIVGRDGKITAEMIEDAIKRTSKCFDIEMSFAQYHPEVNGSIDRPSVSRKVSCSSDWKYQDDSLYIYK